MQQQTSDVENILLTRLLNKSEGEMEGSILKVDQKRKHKNRTD
jgi:hypothetical protein